MLQYDHINHLQSLYDIVVRPHTAMIQEVTETYLQEFDSPVAIRRVIFVTDKPIDYSLSILFYPDGVITRFPADTLYLNVDKWHKAMHKWFGDANVVIAAEFNLEDEPFLFSAPALDIDGFSLIGADDGTDVQCGVYLYWQSPKPGQPLHPNDAAMLMDSRIIYEPAAYADMLEARG